MTISFTEAVGGPVPGTEIEINLQGLGGLPSGDNIRNILVLSERVAAGTSTADEVRSTPFADADEASAWFGAGSPGAHQCAYIFDYRNSESGKPKCAVYGAAVAELPGGTAAVQDLTFATAASAAGVWVFSVGGFQFSVTVSSGDTAIEQATATVAAWEALAEKDSVPITAANGGGANPIVTWTANTKGAHYNNIGLETITDPGITTTATWENTTMGGGVPGTPGAGVAPTLTTVIANLASFTGAGQIVIPWMEDGNAAAQSFEVVAAEALIDHINDRADATNMQPTSLIMGYKTTAANFATIMAAAPFAAEDDQRVSLAAHPYSAVKGAGAWDGELSAQFAAMRASETHMARSFDGLKFPQCHVPYLVRCGGRHDHGLPGLRARLGTGQARHHVPYVHRG
jgi:phage tail sheath gpL-like